VTRRSIEDLLAALSIIAQENSMVQMLPDRTFYPSAALAGEAPAEGLAYVALLAAANGKKNGPTDAIGVVDVDPASPQHGQLVGKAH